MLFGCCGGGDKGDAGCCVLCYYSCVFVVVLMNVFAWFSLLLASCENPYLLIAALLRAPIASSRRKLHGHAAKNRPCTYDIPSLSAM